MAAKTQASALIRDDWVRELALQDHFAEESRAERSSGEPKSSKASPRDSSRSSVSERASASLDATARPKRRRSWRRTSSKASMRRPSAVPLGALPDVLQSGCFARHMFMSEYLRVELDVRAIVFVFCTRGADR